MDVPDPSGDSPSEPDTQWLGWSHARRQGVRMSAVAGLAGAALCLAAVLVNVPDVLQAIWMLNFGVILCAVPYFMFRFLLWRCPACHVRLDWHLEKGRCAACGTLLENEDR